MASAERSPGPSHVAASGPGGEQGGHLRRVGIRQLSAALHEVGTVDAAQHRRHLGRAHHAMRCDSMKGMAGWV
jgi:hypothetical protein